MVHSFVKVDQEVQYRASIVQDRHRGENISTDVMASREGSGGISPGENYERREAENFAGEELSYSDSSASVEERSSYFNNVVPMPSVDRGNPADDVLLVGDDEFEKYLRPTEPDDSYVSTACDSAVDACGNNGVDRERPGPAAAAYDPASKNLYRLPTTSQHASVGLPETEGVRQELEELHATSSANNAASFRVIPSADQYRSSSEPLFSTHFFEGMKRNRNNPTTHTSGTQTGLDLHENLPSGSASNRPQWNVSREKLLPYRLPGETQVLQVLSSTEDESETSSMLNKVRHVSGKDAEELDAPTSISQAPASTDKLFQNVYAKTVQRLQIQANDDLDGDKSHAKSRSVDDSSVTSCSGSERPMAFKKYANDVDRLNALDRSKTSGAKKEQMLSQFSSLLVEYDEDVSAFSSSDSSSRSNFSVIKATKTAAQQKSSSSESVFSLSQATNFKLWQTVNGETDKHAKRGKSAKSSAAHDWQKLKKRNEQNLALPKYETDESSASRQLSNEVAAKFKNCLLTESTYAKSTTTASDSSTFNVSSRITSMLSKADTSASPSEVKHFLLLEHQRKTYVKRLKKEIRWLEKIQRLLKDNEESTFSSERASNKMERRHQKSPKNKKQSVGDKKQTDQLKDGHFQGISEKSTRKHPGEILPTQRSDAAAKRDDVMNRPSNHPGRGEETSTTYEQNSFQGRPKTTPSSFSSRSHHGGDAKNALIFKNENFRFARTHRHPRGVGGSRDRDALGDARGNAERIADRSIADSASVRVIVGKECVQSKSVQTSPVTVTAEAAATQTSPERYFISLPAPKQQATQQNHSKPKDLRKHADAPNKARRANIIRELSETYLERQDSSTSDKDSHRATNLAWCVEDARHAEPLMPNSSDLPNSITLQDALAWYRGNFIARSRARIQQIKTLASVRQHTVFRDFLTVQHEILRPQERNSNPFATRLPSSGRKMFTDQEMKRQNKKLYEALPEIIGAEKDRHRKAIYETNRLKARIFKNKVLERTLRGQVSFSLTKSIL